MVAMHENSEEERCRALHKYRLIQPFLQKEKSLLSLCKEENLPLRTVKRWVTSYRCYGLEGLIRKKRKDKDIKHSVTQHMQSLIEGLHLQNAHLRKISIYRKIRSYAITNQSDYPSYRTICSLLNQLPKGMKTLAHDGRKSYKQQFDLLCRHEAAVPNEIWQADHVLIDFFIFNEDQNKLERPWLTIIMDSYSRAIAGYELSFLSPSALKTSLCLRHAIWQKKEPRWQICGIPFILYTDHGSDFTSQHIEQVCIELKIQLIFSAVGEPRGRGKIERFFRTLNQMLISELEGYGKGSPSKSKLTLAELEEIICNFILAYNQRFHSTIKEIPEERWEKQGFLPRIPDSLELLDLLLLTVLKSRKIRRDGIWFQGLRYLDPVLANYIGELVIIRYDPRDITSIRVFYKNQYLCQPICQELDKQSVSLKEIQTARNKRRKELQNEINRRLSLVDAILSSKQPPRISRESPKINTQKSKLKLYATDE